MERIITYRREDTRGYLHEFADKIEKITADRGKKNKEDLFRKIIEKQELKQSYLPRGDRGFCDLPDGTYEICELDGSVIINEDEAEEHEDYHMYSLIPVEYIEGGVPVAMDQGLGGTDLPTILKLLTPDF